MTKKFFSSSEDTTKKTGYTPPESPFDEPFFADFDGEFHIPGLVRFFPPPSPPAVTPPPVGTPLPPVPPPPINTGGGTGTTTIINQINQEQSDWNETNPNDVAFILNKPALAPANAERNINADWNETNPASDAFIFNKPTIPTGGGGTITLTDDAILDIAQPIRIDADRGKLLATSRVNENDLVLIDAPTGGGTPIPAREPGTGLSLVGNTLNIVNPFTIPNANKLAGIEANAERNVQPNWNTTDDTLDSFIRNKPTSLGLDLDSNVRIQVGSSGLGTAARVGTASDFGVSEGGASGLAVHNGQLYMVGTVNDVLYVLNPDSGVATRVGSSVQFGVSEGAPSGLASHNGVLYMIGRGEDDLYVLNTTLGSATRISTQSAFGISEGRPAGLASHNGILYMVGWNVEALLSLDPATGLATRIGNVDQFGVAEAQPQGLASHNGRLYMIGATNSAIYTLDVNTGEASYVSRTIAAFGISENDPSGIASLNQRLYMVGRSQDALYIINVDDTPVSLYDGSLRNAFVQAGIFEEPGINLDSEIVISSSDSVLGQGIRVGSSVQFGVSEQFPAGLTAHNNQLYMVGNGNDALFTLDVTSGVATRVGSVEFFNINEQSPQALASHNGRLYMAGTGNDRLYELDPATGIATQIGTSSRFGVDEFAPRGMTSHNGTLYMLGGALMALFSLNTTTGIATRIGNVEQFGIEEIAPHSLTSDGINLYLGGADSDALWILSETTGAATRRIGMIDDFGVGEGTPNGLTFFNGELYMVGRDTANLYRIDITSPPVSQFSGTVREAFIQSGILRSSQGGVIANPGSTAGDPDLTSVTIQGVTYVIPMGSGGGGVGDPRLPGIGLTLVGNTLNISNPFTSADETKLNSIATGAEVNVQADWNVVDISSDSFIRNKPNIPPSINPRQAGSGLILTGNILSVENIFTQGLEDKLNQIEDEAEVNVQSDWNITDSNSDSFILNKPTIPTPIPAREAGTGLTLTGNQLNVETPYTSQEKTKLSGIATGAEVNVQADWAESNSLRDSFIRNKPNIPTNTQTIDDDFILDLAQPSRGTQDRGKFLGTSETNQNALALLPAPLGEQNVQADWNETDSVNDAYIRNKPNIEPPRTAGDGLNLFGNELRVDNIFTQALENKLNSLSTITSIGSGLNLIAGELSSTGGGGGTPPPVTPATKEELFSATRSGTLSNGADFTMNLSKAPTAGTTVVIKVLSSSGNWRNYYFEADDFLFLNPNDERIFFKDHRTEADVGSGSFGHSSVQIRRGTNNTTMLLRGSHTSLWGTTPSFTVIEIPTGGSGGGGTAFSAGVGLSFSGTVLNIDTPFTNGERNKLSGIQTGAERNVQSDWDESDTSSDAFIRNKPTSLGGGGTSVLANPASFSTDELLLSVEIAGTVYRIQQLGDVPSGAPGDYRIGTSTDITLQPSEFTIESSNGIGILPSYSGERYIIFARALSEPDPQRLIFSDGGSFNQINAFSKQSFTLNINGTDYNIWRSNQLLMQPTDVSLVIT